jgi:hypothetical protein
MDKHLLETSIIISLLKNLRKRYCYLQQRIDKIYKYSQIYRLIQGLGNEIKVCFRYSFLGRITDIEKEESKMILDNSWIMQYFLSFYKRWKSKFIYCLKTSKVMNLIKETKGEFYILPVKRGSTIVVIAVVTNITLSIILQKDISLGGWLIRGALLLLGIAGLFCIADYQSFKDSSIIFKLLSRR